MSDMSAQTWHASPMTTINTDAFEDAWEDEPARPTRRGKDLSVAARAKIDAEAIARVIGVDRGRLTVVVDGEVMDASLTGTMRGVKACVGDRVRVRTKRHATDTPAIRDILPRETQLTRTADDAREEERVVVANVDTVFVVVTASYLDVGVRFFDRVLVAASAGGVHANLVINKLDLVDDLAEANDVAARYHAIGVDVWLTSAITGEGVAALDTAIGGRWVAFAGHSGVGKSSLLNRLVPDANQRVADVGRHGGRHTTVSAHAWPNRHGGWLIDTPGVRSFGLAGVTSAKLSTHFPELAALRCALDDCAHDSEPGCTMASAVMHPKRKEAYLRLKTALAHGVADTDETFAV